MESNLSLCLGSLDLPVPYSIERHKEEIPDSLTLLLMLLATQIQSVQSARAFSHTQVAGFDLSVFIDYHQSQEHGHETPLERP